MSARYFRALTPPPAHQKSVVWYMPYLYINGTRKITASSKNLRSSFYNVLFCKICCIQIIVMEKSWGYQFCSAIGLINLTLSEIYDHLLQCAKGSKKNIWISIYSLNRKVVCTVMSVIFLCLCMRCVVLAYASHVLCELVV